MIRLTVFHRLALAMLLLIAGFAAFPLQAQELPDADIQEAVIKEALITFNDANVTGNYDVLHGKLSRPFQEQYSPADLSDMFKSFRDNEIYIWAVAGMDPIPDEPTKVEDGILKLKGHFPTAPLQVNYELEFILEDSYWRMIAFNVGANPPG